MGETMTIDRAIPTHMISMKDAATGKAVAQRPYLVMAGAEVIKTVLDRRLTFQWGPDQVQAVPELMTSQERSYASVASDAVQVAL